MEFIFETTYKQKALTTMAKGKSRLYIMRKVWKSL